jgi:hypothetical protein
VAEWVLNLHRHESPTGAVRNQIAALIREQWCPDATPELNTFLNDDRAEVTTEGQKANNVFQYGDIEIEVGTVHSVKGETHTATLYLETFNYENDSKRLLLFLKGQYPEAESKKVRHIENLKVAHVAFSRPTHLLVFACQEAAIVGHESDLKNNGWEIKNVNEILNHEQPISIRG